MEKVVSVLQMKWVKTVIGALLAFTSIFGLVASGLAQTVYQHQANVVNVDQLNDGMVYSTLVFSIIGIVLTFFALSAKPVMFKTNWAYYVIIGLAFALAIVLITLSGILFDDMQTVGSVGVAGSLPVEVPKP